MKLHRLATALLLLLGACTAEDKPSPFAYRNPVDVVRASLGLGNYCSRPEPGTGYSTFIGEEACYRFRKPERMRGVWLDEFEGSMFVEGRDTPVPSFMQWYDDGAWLEFGRAAPPSNVKSCRESERRCVFQVEFVGRRAAFPGEYGHMGGSRHMVLVDQVLSMREIPDPVGEAQVEAYELRDLLLSEGFSGALADGGDRLRLLGAWTGKSGTYRAYFYEHTDPAREGGHTVRSVVVIDDRDRYLGRYTVDAPDARMVGPAIILGTAPADGDRIVLGDDGPPSRVRLDGQIVELAK